MVTADDCMTCGRDGHRFSWRLELRDAVLAFKFVHRAMISAQTKKVLAGTWMRGLRSTLGLWMGVMPISVTYRE